MSAVVVGHPSFRHALGELRQLVREATALGAAFRISGAETVITFPALFPSALRDRLCEYRDNGWLGPYLGAERLDRPAKAFAAKLGVDAAVVTRRREVGYAIWHLERDLAAGEGHLGLDIETSPRPGQGEAPPAIQFNDDGTVAERQPPWRNDAGLDPHRAVIACLQLYAGGDYVFLFRGEALQRVLGLRWLRRQHLVVHNAGFETKFLLHHAPRKPVTVRALPGTSSDKPPKHRCKTGRLECTMQAMGLLRGVGYGGGGRGLDKAAKAFLGLDVPKELQRSDWSAAELSEGQIAYAGTDAILAWRLWPKMDAELTAKQRWAAYDLQRRAIPAVADMELRGLGFARQVHAEQIRQWSVGLAEARHRYHELTGTAPPNRPTSKPGCGRYWSSIPSTFRSGPSPAPGSYRPASAISSA